MIETVRQLVPQLAADRDDGCRVQLSAGKCSVANTACATSISSRPPRSRRSPRPAAKARCGRDCTPHPARPPARGTPRVDKALPHVREHAAGCRVDDDLHVRAVHGLAVQQGIALAGAAGGQNLLSPAVAADRRDRRVRTARAQDQHGLARKIYTVGPGQIGKAA